MCQALARDVLLYWIGRAPGAGKSSVTRILARRNLESLRLTDAMDEVPEHWYTSMYLATGYAYYHLNQLDQAAAAYEQARASLDPGDISEYAREVRDTIAAGLARVQNRRPSQ